MWGLIGMGEAEEVYCCALRRHHTSEANESQPDTAGNSDFVCDQPEHLRLDATRGSDPAMVGRAVEEAARAETPEAEVAGGMSEVQGVVTYPARTRASTCAGVEGSQEPIRTPEDGDSV